MYLSYLYILITLTNITITLLIFIYLLIIIGYLKNETNEDVAECFLKSSPHLTECYQMFKANRKFNIKVNGLNLNNLFDIFGTMCSMSKFLY